MSDPITIRPARTIADYHACQDAQRRAWGISEEDYVVPIATMVGAQLHGGLVLGAFRDDGTAVGLSFGFLGRIDGKLGLYSQLTGVVPGQQGQGLGGRLKETQRQFARAAGLDLIAWAFDPLQAGNAHFNLGRLGARSHTYAENMYGTRTDPLNAGVPTDRMIVVWDTSDERPTRPRVGVTDLERLPRIVEEVEGPDGARDVVARDPAAMRDQSRVMLEIPAAIGRLRMDAPALAERWRSAVATAFTGLFAAGFEADDFVRSTAAGHARGFYVLSAQRASSEAGPTIA
jgi:predicted GNAT superfamily acetyltransferase